MVSQAPKVGSMPTAPFSCPSRSIKRLHSRRPGENIIDESSFEVNVNALGVKEDWQHDQSASSEERQLKHSRTLYISPTGHCVPVVEKDENVIRRTSTYLSMERRDSDIKSTEIERKCFYKNSKKAKIIEANEDVLSNYHDSYLYGKVLSTIKVRAAIRSGKLGQTLMWIESFAALALVIFYVRSTYASELQGPWKVVRVFCALFFVVDYMIKLYSAPVRLYYIVSYTGIVDLMSTLPFFVIWSPWREDEYFPQLFLFIRLSSITPYLAATMFPGNTIGQKIFQLTLHTFGAVFIIAGILQWVERKAVSEEYKRENDSGSHDCINFFDAFYFVIVTISTVGYGDITMHSEWSRAIIMVTILVALLVLPIQVNKILELAYRRPYGGKFRVQKVVDSRFVIISGNLSYRTVQDFLSEFYHPSHEKDMSTFPLRVVIMAPYKPSFEMKTLVANYKGHVEFFEGTPLNESDLVRVGARVASAVFLMADRHAVDPDAEDAVQFVRTLCVHRYCGSTVRVIAEMLKPENKNSAVLDDIFDGIEVVCLEAVRFHFLARSCHIKGLSPFLTNLFKSGLPISNSGLESWLRQYDEGLQQNVFPVILPSCFHTEGLLFEEAAEIIYRRYHVILFGLDVFEEDDVAREVVLYPGGRQILSSDIGLVIAKDIWAAEEISKFGKENPFLQRLKSCSFGGTSNENLNYARDSELLEEIKRNRLSNVERSVDTSEYFIAPFTCDFSSDDLHSDYNAKMSQTEQINDRQRKFQTIMMCGHAKSQLETSPAKSQKIISLEEAMDIAMSWPPANKWGKPEPPVLEKRANIITDNLFQRTLSMTNLESPHILLCIQGVWPINLYYLISYLRDPCMPNPPVVILHPRDPDFSEWGCVGMFEQVYFVKGSPLYELDLVRAGVLQAEKVIILAQRCREAEAKDNESLTDVTAVSFDINNILIAATVERLTYPFRDRIVVELQNESQIHHLRPKYHISKIRFNAHLYARNRESDYMFTPPYIEGKGFSPTALNFLLYATFFNRNTISILEKLLSGGEHVMTSGGSQAFVKRLEQIPVPKVYIGKSVMDLFLHALRNRNILVLGLQRPRGTCNSEVSYVYTNPKPMETLVEGDLLYIIRS